MNYHHPHKNHTFFEDLIKYSLKFKYLQIFYKICHESSSSMAKYGRRRELNFIINVLALKQIFEIRMMSYDDYTVIDFNEIALFAAKGALILFMKCF
jgi:hypothetical protein